MESINRRFIKACKENNVEDLKSVIYKSMNPNLKVEKGENVLLTVCRCNNETFLNFLLDKYKDLDVNVQNNKGETALSLCIKNKNIFAVRLLLNLYDMNIYKSNTSFKEQPIVNMIDYQLNEISNELIDRMDYNCINYIFTKSYSDSRYLYIFKYLISNFNEKLQIIDIVLCFINSLKRDDYKIIELIIVYSNIKDIELYLGYEFYENLVYYRRKNVIDLLLDNNIDLNCNYLNKDGETLLINLCRKGRYESIEFMLNNLEVDLDIQDNSNRTALIYLGTMWNIPHHIINLFKHANPNIKDKFNKTALIYFSDSEYSYLDCFINVFKNIDATIRDNKGRNVLYHSRTRENSKLLLDNFPDLNINDRDSNGNTLLSYLLQIIDQEEHIKFYVDKNIILTPCCLKDKKYLKLEYLLLIEHLDNFDDFIEMNRYDLDDVQDERVIQYFQTH